MKRMTSKEILHMPSPSWDEFVDVLIHSREEGLARYFPGYEADARRYVRTRSRYDSAYNTPGKFFSDLRLHVAGRALEREKRRSARARVLRSFLGWLGIFRPQPKTPSQEFEDIADELAIQGYVALVNESSTGSLYLHAWNDDTEFQVRLSDHDPAPGCAVDADCRTIEEVRAAVERLQSSRRAKVLDG